jgi:hypothetical protein
MSRAKSCRHSHGIALSMCNRPGSVSRSAFTKQQQISNRRDIAFFDAETKNDAWSNYESICRYMTTSRLAPASAPSPG